MRLKALIFDLDGTMADTEETHRQAFNSAFEAFDLRWNWSRLAYSDLLDVSGGPDRIRHYIETLALPPAEHARLGALVPEIHATKTRIYAEMLGDGRTPLRPGVERLFREARADGLRLGVVSTTAAANASALLRMRLGPYGLDKVDALVAAEDVRKRKPAPDIYLRALTVLGMPVEACVAFEDSANGMLAARAAGAFAVVTPTRWTMAQDFSGADLLLRSLGDADSPLHPSDAETVGAEELGLAQLRRLRERVRERG